MALKDILAIIDTKLADVFHSVKYDPAKDRAKLVKAIDAKRNVTVKNDVAEYRLSFGGRPIKIETHEVAYVPAERLDDLKKHLREAATNGEFDAQLEAINKADAAGDAKPTRKASTGGTKAGWSDERRAAFSASIAARKAAKAAETK